MNRLKIGVVGPCTSGKSTLVYGLQSHHIWGKHIAQEHSYVPNMWQRLTRPDVLIYLDVSYPVSLTRRQMDWSESEYNDQIYRLRHAREHADLYIHTDSLTAEQVLEQVLNFLQTLERSGDA